MHPGAREHRAASPGTCSRWRTASPATREGPLRCGSAAERPRPSGTRLENPRRGIYASGEVVVESRAPFGLFYGRRRMRVASETVVYPRTFDVAGLPPSAVTDAERGDRSEASTLHRGHGGEFWGVREYRPGDPARLVAWKRSARGLPSGKLAVIELAQETHPPFVLALNLDPRAPPEAREMVVSAGASLLLYGLDEGREVRADAGPENPPFPEEVTRDSVLTWCAGLRYSTPPDQEERSSRYGLPQGGLDTTEGKPVIPRPARRLRGRRGRRARLVPRSSPGPGPWMSPEGEEQEFMERVEASGRLVARLGAEVVEPVEDLMWLRWPDGDQTSRGPEASA